MGDLADGHRRHAVLARAFDGEVDGGDAGDLAEADATVEQHGGPAVGDGGDHGVGAEVAAAHAPGVERHQVRAVRVDAAQVGLEQVVGDRRRLRVREPRARRAASPVVDAARPQG